MATDAFDSKEIEKLGWRQGAILAGEVAKAAIENAPPRIEIIESDWLILSSHDCDICNFSLTKEPVVEIIRARVTDSKTPDKQHAWGRNPRSIHFEGANAGQSVVLTCNVHDRWTVPREKLVLASPCSDRVLDGQVCRIIAEWLAKRYIRAAFPSNFDARWRGERSKNLPIWTKLLESFNQWIQGVYLRLNTMGELSDPDTPYRCHLMVAVPEKLKSEKEWPTKREEIERQLLGFWNQFEPGVICDGVEVLGTDEITLADISVYQRFDADWLSFSEDDESPKTPPVADLTS